MSRHTLVRGQTTIVAPTAGLTLPQTTINVASTSGPPAFASSGTLTIETSDGTQTVTYTSTTGTTFNGCSGGTGTMALGAAVADAWQDIARSELSTLDSNIAASINGVDGGTGAPTSQIVLDGSSGGGLVVSGPTEVRYGGSLTISTTTGMQCHDGDYPVIDQVDNTAFSSRKKVFLFSEAAPAYRSMWQGRREYGGAPQAFAPMFDLSDGQGMRSAIARLRLRAHDGATLTSISINFTVGYPHTVLPTTMPAARVYAVAPDGSFLLLTSTAAGADPFGYIYAPTPTSPAAWYNGGAPQAFTIPIDQNNVLDIASYDYVVEIVDEQGLTDWPFGLTVMQPCRVLASSAVTQFGLFTIDGVALNEGDRILCVAQGSETQNGIWIAHAGGPGQFWTRATDPNPFSFRRGFVVPISAGTNWGGFLFQADQAITSWTPGTAPRTSVWAPAQGVGLPTIPSSAETGLWYIATGTGTSGSTEPTWPTYSGGTVVDPVTSTMTWTAMGPNATPLSFVVHPDKSFPQPADGFIAYGTIWHSAVATFASITDMRPQ